MGFGMNKQDQIRYWKKYRVYLIKWIKRIDKHIAKLKR